MSFFLFVFAVWFIVVTSPLWFILGSITIPIIAVIKFFGYFSEILGGYFKYEEYADGMLALLIAIPVSFWDGIKAFFDPVSYAWDFARYDHPFWAFFISFCLTIIYANSSKN